MNTDKHHLYNGDFVVYQSGNVIRGYFEELKVATIARIRAYDVFSPKNKDLWYFDLVKNCPWRNGRLITLPETRIVLNEDLSDIYETDDHAPRSIYNFDAIKAWKFYEETKNRLSDYAKANREVLKYV